MAFSGQTCAHTEHPIHRFLLIRTALPSRYMAGHASLLMQSRWFLHFCGLIAKGFAFLALPIPLAKRGQNSLDTTTEMPSYSRVSLSASMVFLILKGLT